MINCPPAERAAIILSYDRHIDLIMGNLRSRLEAMKYISDPMVLIMLQTYHAREKRQLTDSLNERLELCEQYSRSK